MWKAPSLSVMFGASLLLAVSSFGCGDNGPTNAASAAGAAGASEDAGSSGQGDAGQGADGQAGSAAAPVVDDAGIVIAAHSIPTTVTLDSERVYWFDLFATNLGLNRADLDGSHPSHPGAVGTDLWVNSTTLVWVSGGSYKVDGQTVQLSSLESAPLTGKPSSELVSAPQGRLIVASAIDEDNAYWIEDDGVLGADVPAGIALMKTALSGGGPEVLATEFDTALISSLIVGDEFLYFQAGHSIVRVEKTGGDVETVISGVKQLGRIALHDAWLYWSDEAGIHRAKPDGTKSELIISGVTVLDLAVESGNVYWSTSDDGGKSIQRASVNGGQVATLASDVYVGSPMTVGSLGVYIYDKPGTRFLCIPK